MGPVLLTSAAIPNKGLDPRLIRATRHPRRQASLMSCILRITMSLEMHDCSVSSCACAYKGVILHISTLPPSLFESALISDLSRANSAPHRILSNDDKSLQSSSTQITETSSDTCIMQSIFRTRSKLPPCRVFRMEILRFVRSDSDCHFYGNSKI